VLSKSISTSTAAEWYRAIVVRMSFGTVTWVRFLLTGKRTAISNCTQTQIEDFLVLAKIHDDPEEGWTLSRKCNTWKDCPGYLTSLNTNNVKFCRQNRPYQPEAFGPSGPSLGFGTKSSSAQEWKNCTLVGGKHRPKGGGVDCKNRDYESRRRKYSVWIWKKMSLHFLTWNTIVK